MNVVVVVPEPGLTAHSSSDRFVDVAQTAALAGAANPTSANAMASVDVMSRFANRRTRSISGTGSVRSLSPGTIRVRGPVVPAG